MKNLHQESIRECSSLHDIFDAVKYVCNKGNNKARHNFFFRGQSNANWNLISSLKRNEELIQSYSQANKKEKIEIIIEEIKREISIYNNFIEDYCDDIKFIEMCQKIIIDNKLKLKIIDIPSKVHLKDHISVLALMQHYGFKTRALDFTENLMVALFFAVSKAKNDAALWVLNKNMMNTILYNQNKSVFSVLPVCDNINFSLKQKYVDYLNHDLNFYKTKLTKILKNDEDNGYCISEALRMDIISAKDKAEELKQIGYEAYCLYASSLQANLFNKRLQRQSGVFVLQSYKPVNIQLEYDELIENIKQGQFIATGKPFDSKRVFSPFTKIVIKKNCFQEIRSFLNIIGVNEENLGLKED